MAAFYRAKIAGFLNHSRDEVLGALLRSYQHNELQKRQTKAWETEIEVLKSTCADLVRLVPGAAQWSLLLEYPIPRRSKRILQSWEDRMRCCKPRPQHLWRTGLCASPMWLPTEPSRKLQAQASTVRNANPWWNRGPSNPERCMHSRSRCT